MLSKKARAILFFLCLILIKESAFASQKTIAILPFDNLTQDKNLDWLREIIDEKN